MLETLRAVDFMQILHGSKKPCLFLCQFPDGQEIEVVVKFKETVSRGRLSLVFEVLCWHLAKQLELSVPQAYVVDVPKGMDEFVSDPEYAHAVRSSPGLNFGSEFISRGNATIPSHPDWEQFPPQWVFDVFAFDFSIRNFDRHKSNRNLLYDGHQYFLIDHEEAFKDAHQVLADEALEVNPYYNHYFYPLLGLAPNWSTFYSLFGSISDKEINQWVQDCPTDWLAKPDEIDMIMGYLKWLRGCLDHLDQTMKSMLVSG